MTEEVISTHACYMHVVMCVTDGRTTPVVVLLVVVVVVAVVVRALFLL